MSEKENPSILWVNGGSKESIHPLWEELSALVFLFTGTKQSPASSWEESHSKKVQTLTTALAWWSLQSPFNLDFMQSSDYITHKHWPCSRNSWFWSSTFSLSSSIMAIRIRITDGTRRPERRSLYRSVKVTQMIALEGREEGWKGGREIEKRDGERRERGSRTAGNERVGRDGRNV